MFFLIFSQESNTTTFGKRINSDAILDEEEQVIDELIKQHRKFYKDWDSKEFSYKYNIDTQVNLFLHITLDSIVVNQINSNSPKQTRFTYKSSRGQGDSYLETIPKIASIVLENIWVIMKLGNEFNEIKYIQKIKKTSQNFNSIKVLHRLVICATQ